MAKSGSFGKAAATAALLVVIVWGALFGMGLGSGQDARRSAAGAAIVTVSLSIWAGLAVWIVTVARSAVSAVWKGPGRRGDGPRPAQ